MARATRPRAYLTDTVYAALRRAILDREFDPAPDTVHVRRVRDTIVRLVE